MFVREKRINGYTYLYLVETVREDGRAKQRIIKNLGRKEAVTASGALERLASSVARYAERVVVLSQIKAGNPEGLACKRIGAPLLFGRLWEETGCRAVVDDLLAGRDFEFAVERAVFATVLHRIMVSGSDRACEKWRARSEPETMIRCRTVAKTARSTANSKSRPARRSSTTARQPVSSHRRPNSSGAPMRLQARPSGLPASIWDRTTARSA